MTLFSADDYLIEPRGSTDPAVNDEVLNSLIAEIKRVVSNYGDPIGQSFEKLFARAMEIEHIGGHDVFDATGNGIGWSVKTKALASVENLSPSVMRRWYRLVRLGRLSDSTFEGDIEGFGEAALRLWREKLAKGLSNHGCFDAREFHFYYSKDYKRLAFVDRPIIRAVSNERWRSTGNGVANGTYWALKKDRSFWGLAPLPAKIYDEFQT